jgi:hypothetical protein
LPTLRADRELKLSTGMMAFLMYFRMHREIGQNIGTD